MLFLTLVALHSSFNIGTNTLFSESPDWRNGKIFIYGDLSPSSCPALYDFISLLFCILSYFCWWKMRQVYKTQHDFNGGLGMMGGKHDAKSNLWLVLNVVTFRIQTLKQAHPPGMPFRWFAAYITGTRCLEPSHLLQVRPLLCLSLTNNTETVKQCSGHNRACLNFSFIYDKAHAAGQWGRDTWFNKWLWNSFSYGRKLK